MNKTNIAWTNYTWNPVTGCSPISEGCQNCYAAAINKRFHLPQKVQFHPDRLDEPLKRKKPCMIFAGSMTDLFHKDVKDEWIDQIMAIIAICQQRIFQVLTKRADRLLDYFNRMVNDPIYKPCDYLLDGITDSDYYKNTGATLEKQNAEKWDKWYARLTTTIKDVKWPLPNLWLGVTVEIPEYLWRVEKLLQIRAAVRFVSLEPLLDGIVLGLSKCSGCGATKKQCDDWKNGPMKSIACCPDCNHQTLDWVIVGAETGPGRRPCKLEWVRSIIEQCAAAAVPCFVKQIEINGKISHDISEWPADLQVRQWPERK